MSFAMGLIGFADDFIKVVKKRNLGLTARQKFLAQLILSAAFSLVIYEIKGGDKSKANGGIGIVPYVYKDAYNYHYNLWLAQQKNKDVKIELYTPQVKEIVIPRPQRKVKKRQLFTFLDE